ncbi:MAG: hypothetical protein K8R23_07070 [Chthoniobacter sp.]|nr:hypothetical protein [Chthoniobacter sp.]
MNTKLFTGIVTLFAIATAGSGFAKDKDKNKDKGKDRDRDREPTVYVTKDGGRYYVDGDGRRHWLETAERRNYRDDRDREERGDRKRTIYVIERDRPVSREVFVDHDGNYYRWVDGRRVYIRDRYFESYPSKYYTPDGRRRVTITLPF